MEGVASSESMWEMFDLLPHSKPTEVKMMELAYFWRHHESGPYIFTRNFLSRVLRNSALGTISKIITYCLVCIKHCSKCYIFIYIRASQVVLVAKNLPANAGGFDPSVREILKKWQPTPVFLPGKFHVQRSLAGYSPWGHKGSDMTEHTHSHTYTLTSPDFKASVLLGRFWDWLVHSSCL